MKNAGTPRDIAFAFLRAMEAKDYDEALRYVAHDCEYENIPLGKVKGPEGVRGVLEPFFAPTIENKFDILREASNGPIVFVERLDRHLVKTGWVNLPVTGVFEIRDGLIHVWREYFDAATIVSKWPTS
jgi:limonene-1,2-epoxide hydrolase